MNGDVGSYPVKYTLIFGFVLVLLQWNRVNVNPRGTKTLLE